jgi:hypothetical protein
LSRRSKILRPSGDHEAPARKEPLASSCKPMPLASTTLIAIRAGPFRRQLLLLASAHEQTILGRASIDHAHRPGSEPHSAGQISSGVRGSKRPAPVATNRIEPKPRRGLVAVDRPSHPQCHRSMPPTRRAWIPAAIRLPGFPVIGLGARPCGPRHRGTGSAVVDAKTATTPGSEVELAIHTRLHFFDPATGLVADAGVRVTAPA